MVFYGNMACGGTNIKALNPIQNLQNRLLKIVNKHLFVFEEYLLNLRQLFAFELLEFLYNVFKDRFGFSSQFTRNKNIIIPQISNNYSTVCLIKQQHEITLIAGKRN